MTYQRTSTIRTERLDTDGIIEGTLASNGEASDGHILEPRGIEVDGAVPLLFGHDAHSGRNNLGSWVAFHITGQKRAAAIGDAQLHGSAQIELGGSGTQAEFRQDVAHMVAEGHINAFSLRWDPIGDPVRRTDLPSKHYAHAGEDAPALARGGLFFETSRVIEGSVVTVGADKAALVARALESQGREVWAAVIGADMLGEVFNRVEDMQARLDVLELVPPPPLEIVPGNVIPVVVPEDSAPSPQRTPDSHPGMGIDQMVDLFDAFLERSDDRIRERQDRAIMRLVG